jgi:hypothetical protein
MIQDVSQHRHSSVADHECVTSNPLGTISPLNRTEHSHEPQSSRRFASPRRVCLIAEVESPDSLGISSAAISNEQICQLVCRTSCACVAGGCVQISWPPDPHRGRASATDSRRPAKATSRMDRGRRRVSHVRFLRGAPEPTLGNLCAIRPSRSCPQRSTLNYQLSTSLLSFGSRRRACNTSPARTATPVADSPWRARSEVSSRRRIPWESDSQQGEALDKCLPPPSLLALFEDSYLVTNVNRTGDEGRLTNSENRFALVYHHAASL